jgi:lysophospholipase L1-like esterase
MINSASRFSKVLGITLLVRLYLAGVVFALPSDSLKVKRVGFQPKKVQPQYPFVKYSQNKLFIPDSQAMQHFYEALDSLRSGKKQKVNVIHIGDSHIQADVFSGIMRTLLQDSNTFGNGGRGLIFPYPLAKTNNPWNYKVSYTGAWTGCRNVQYNQTCDWGLAGVTAETIDSSAAFSLITDTNFGKWPVSKIRVFYPAKDASQFSVKIEAADSTYFPTGIDSLGFAEFQLAYEVSKITVKISRTSKTQTHFTLQGVSLENNREGLVYSSLGVNGAEVLSFLRSPVLEANLQALKPNLVIISLGTNDAYGKNFSPEVFFQNYGTLLQRIQRAAPKASVLLTGPGDNYRKRKYPNYHNAKATMKLYELAEQTNCAVWSFYKVMGGLRSIVKWQYNGLAAKDRVHLTPKGYNLQGELLFDALMQEYLKTSKIQQQ